MVLLKGMDLFLLFKRRYHVQLVYVYLTRGVCLRIPEKKRKTVILYKVAHIKSINSGNFHSEYLGSIPNGEGLRKMMLGVGL